MEFDGKQINLRVNNIRKYNTLLHYMSDIVICRLLTSYEPFLDYLKSYCIIWVVFCHVFPYLQEVGYPVWGGVQVPLFFLIQAFHFYKKEDSHINISKLAKRIILPFLLVVFLQFLLMALIYGLDYSASQILLNGGAGPGSYYPWCYLQFTVILFALKPIIHKKLTLWKKGLLILLIAIPLEFLAQHFLPENLYRLCATRYIFLSYLGYIWVEEGIVLNIQTFLLSIISIIIIIFFSYSNSELVLSLNKYGWVSHQWVCYFWPTFLYSVILYYIYKYVRRFEKVHKTMRIISQSTYEIFLSQMFVLTFYSKGTLMKGLSIIFQRDVDNNFVSVIWMCSALLISIFVGIYWRLLLDKLHTNKS